MRRTVAALWLLLSCIGAWASQSNTWSPTVGTVSGLQLTVTYNNAFSAIQSSNSGGSPPSNDQTLAPVVGQFWLNTSRSPNILQMYTGTSWGTLGWLDSANQQWISGIAGAPVTVASALTTDLCNGAPGGALSAAPTILVSGSASINSFGGSCPVGQVKILIFSGTPTIVSNLPSMILPAATSISVGAGDTMVVVNNGNGSWTSVSYQKFIATVVNLNTIGSFWTDINDADGNMNARINALRDRVFVDDGSLQSGSWNGGSGGLANSRSGTALNSVGWNWQSRDGSLVSISSWGELAVVGQSVTSMACRSGDPHTCTGASAIGVTGVGLNDSTTNLRSAWGGYFESLRKSASVGTGLAIESDIGNFGSIVDINPFSSATGATGHTTNLWAQCGGSATGGVYANCSAGLAFGNNGARYRKGILFFNTGLDQSIGSGGGGIAMELGDGQSMRWMDVTTNIDGEIWSSSANGGTMFLSPRIDLRINGANVWTGNGAVATNLGNTGPTGSHTAVQVWFTVFDNTGTLRYIPAF